MPYIILGYVQVFLIILAAKYLFSVPFHSSIILLLFATLAFIAVNLAIWLIFPSFANNQLKAAHMSTFSFLPSLLLYGFMFHFRWMPLWTEVVVLLLLLTYFLRIACGIILKGNGIA